MTYPLKLGNLTSVTPPGRPAHTFNFDGLDYVSVYIPPSLTTGATPTTYAYNPKGLDTRPKGLFSRFASVRRTGREGFALVWRTRCVRLGGHDTVGGVRVLSRFVVRIGESCHVAVGVGARYGMKEKSSAEWAFVGGWLNFFCHCFFG